MKRIPEYKKEDYGITKFKTFFTWTECDLCHSEFRREPMWRIFIKNIVPPVPPIPIIDFACSHCLPDIQSAINHRKSEFKKYDSNGRRIILPPPPPPPPPP